MTGGFGFQSVQGRDLNAKNCGLRPIAHCRHVQLMENENLRGTFVSENRGLSAVIPPPPVIPNKLARAAYHMLKNATPFAIERAFG